VRFGVEEREPPAVESSGGAEGERIAARECGEGIVAVGGSYETRDWMTESAGRRIATRSLRAVVPIRELEVDSGS
jgi:hypothetical protein